MSTPVSTKRSSFHVHTPRTSENMVLEKPLLDDSKELHVTVGQGDSSVNVQPIRVEFRNITYTVEKGTKKELEILHGVSGCAEPGQLLGILGESGAGKTSLLNVLARRVSSRSGVEVRGEILFNGAPIKRDILQKHSAYIMQQDILLETLSPAESFEFSSKLRLPASLSNEDRKRRVNEIIEELSLEKCRDTLVGDGNLIMGISGGEKKRTSIGVELIANPELLFVDEPTSGLDSVTALTTVRLLKRLAEAGRTVICTIHQPNSTIFSLFDQLCVLSDGEICYMGPASETVTHFSSLGYDCPRFTNPADFVVELLHGTTVEDKRRVSGIVGTYRKSIEAKLDKHAEEEAHLKPIIDEGEWERPGMWTQFGLLTKRAFLNYIRQPRTTKIRVAQLTFIALMISVVFYKLGNDLNAVRDRTGVLFFACLFQLLNALAAVILVFPMERHLLIRERANNMYEIGPYFAGKLLSELPFQILYVGLFAGIVYPTVGLRAGIQFWFVFAGLSLLMVLTGHGMGLAAGASVASVESAVSLLPLLMIPVILFAGFFVAIENIPIWLRWVQYVSIVKWAYEDFIINEFENTANQDFVFDMFNLDPDDFAFNIYMCIVLFVGFELIAFIILKFTAKNK